MLWIKRNLFFVIGSAAGVILLGVAIYQLLGQMSLDKEVRGRLEQRFEDLRYEYNKPVFPDQKNINLVRADRDRLMQFIANGLAVFKPVEPVKFVGEQGFKTELEKILDYLNKEAKSKNVAVPTNYAYSFQKQKTLIRFEYGSLGILARQLAEVKAICQVLFDAKVNRLESIQRAKASLDDAATDAPASDYVQRPIQSNAVAMVMPYRVTFRCFSSELTDVINGLMQSPHGFLLRSVEVEPVPLEFGGSGPQPGTGMDTSPGTPPPMPPTRWPGRRLPPGVTPPMGFAPPGAPPGSGSGALNPNRLVTLVNEKPFRVVLYIETVVRHGARN